MDHQVYADNGSMESKHNLLDHYYHMLAITSEYLDCRRSLVTAVKRNFNILLNSLWRK